MLQQGDTMAIMSDHWSTVFSLSGDVPTYTQTFWETSTLTASSLRSPATDVSSVTATNAVATHSNAACMSHSEMDLMLKIV